MHHSVASPARIDFSTYAVIPIWYGCNNACAICMLSSLPDRLSAVPFDLFRAFVEKLVHDGGRRNLVLSGGEVTTFEHLERYVEFAASFSWFSRIQIQTNGRRLADPLYLRRLIDAGVNEFFISLHGPDNVHDGLTRRPGSFAQTMKGIENLAGYRGINVITNTVWTRMNSAYATLLFRQIARLPWIRELHLWNYFPMMSGDAADHIESLGELRDRLPEMAAALAPAGKCLVLKAFPQCLPVPEGVFCDSEFPLTIIHDVFWKTLGSSGFGECLHRARCEDWQCWGLSRLYREKYGEEADLLRPMTFQHTRRK